MGGIVSASCKCGYRNDFMFLGGGMLNYDKKCYFPYYCPDCKSMFVANV